MGKSRIVYMVLVMRPDGKKLAEKPKRRLENNIKMDRKQMGWGGMAQDRDKWQVLLKAVTNPLVP